MTGLFATRNRTAAELARALGRLAASDLPLLLESDDPFEGHYNHVLVGDVSVSPNLDVQHLRDVPVLVFHGDRDELVVPEHSHRLKQAVESAGGNVRLDRKSTRLNSSH